MCIILSEVKLCISRHFFCKFTDKYSTVISICLFWDVFFNGDIYVMPIDVQEPVTELVGYVLSKNRKKVRKRGYFILNM